ncbi:MAG: stage II sporulation protein M [Saprospiraceae bacterium]
MNPGKNSDWLRIFPAMLIGALSSAMDPDFVRQILGNSYVDMTLQNIANGDPMAVYKGDKEFGMTLGIGANNLFVAFITFSTGILYGVGTILALIRNGIMVGAFQYFFVEKELFWDSFLTIWMHGAIEISSIVIAGAAGLTMGRGLVFPGTFSRTKSFSLSAKRGLTIMLGITPLIILAAIIEGYLTRHTELPDALRLIFILLCFAFVIGYFVIYPVYKARKGFLEEPDSENISPDRMTEIQFDALKSVGQIFSESFVLFKVFYKQILGFSLVTTAFWCLLYFSFAPPLLLESLPDFGIFDFTGPIFYYFESRGFPYVILINGLCFGITAYGVNYLVAKKSGSTEIGAFSIMGTLKSIIGATALSAILAAPSGLTFLLMVSIFPILLVWMYTMVHENLNLYNSFSRSLGIVSGGFWRMMGVYATILLITVFSFSLANSQLIGMLVNFISINFQLEGSNALRFTVLLFSFFSIWMLQMIFALLMLGIGILYHTLLEIKDANLLKRAISQVGTKSTLKGIEWEGKL